MLPFTNDHPLSLSSLCVAIGSSRRPKVDAVKTTFARLAAHFSVTPEAIEYLAEESASGVDETPKSLEQLMTGSRTRIRSLRHLLNQKGRSAHFYIGLEGGLFSAEGSVFLQSWACVSDGSREAFGASGAIPIPPAIAEAVIRRGGSLGEVIDAFARQENVRSNQGTWGILTKDEFTRQDSFELALLNALAPFYNKELYHRTM